MPAVISPNWEYALSLVESQIDQRGTHVWPFDPSFPVDIRFFVLNRQRDIPMHRPDHCELIFIETGDVPYEIEGKRYLLKKGDLVVVGSQVSHRCCKNEWLRKQTKAVVLLFLPRLLCASEGVGDDVGLLMPFHLHDPNVHHVISAESGIPAQVRDLIDRMRNLLPANSYHSRLAVKAHLQMILAVLMSHYADSPDRGDAFRRSERAVERLIPLFDYLEANHAEPISVQKAARLIGMSRSHFARFFKQVTGKPFIGYLNQFRIVKSQQLLTCTDRSVSEVGQDVGFCSQSYFGLIFRKYANMTPLQYKLQDSVQRTTSTISVWRPAKRTPLV